MSTESRTDSRWWRPTPRTRNNLEWVCVFVPFNLYLRVLFLQFVSSCLFLPFYALGFGTFSVCMCGFQFSS